MSSSSCGTKMRVQSQCMYANAIVEVNVVIGVVLGELHVVRVVPVVVCDDAAVHRIRSHSCIP